MSAARGPFAIESDGSCPITRNNSLTEWSAGKTPPHWEEDVPEAINQTPVGRT
jgi:hypothetical protein